MELETLKEYTRWVAKWVLFGIFVSWLINQMPFGRDNTDEPGWFGKRSGVTPTIDRATGCQYLRTSDGGITPRLDFDGRQVGCKP